MDEICYLDVPKVVVIVKYDGIVLVIPKCTTKVLEFGHLPPFLPPFSKVIVHLSCADNLPTPVLKGFGHLVHILVLENLVRPAAITHHSSHPPKNKATTVVGPPHSPTSTSSSNRSSYLSISSRIKHYWSSTSASCNWSSTMASYNSSTMYQVQGFLF